MGSDGLEIRMIAVRGHAAFGLAIPFHTCIVGFDLPPQTFELLRTIYTWLFAFLGKSSQYSDIRLLEKEFTSEVLIDFYVSEAGHLIIDSFRTEINKTLSSEMDIFYPYSIAVVSPDQIDLRRLLSSRVIYGWEYADQTIQNVTREVGESGLDRVLREVSNKVFAELAIPQVWKDIEHLTQSGIPERLVSIFHLAREEKPIAIDQSSNVKSQVSDHWLNVNSDFFQAVREGEFDEILVIDATKDLKDKKGTEKANQFTLCKVLGLLSGGNWYPAERVVLKLRGFSWYRGDIHNIIDLLKEFASYRYIHARAADAGKYILHSGPLLLSCEKLNVPFDKSEKMRWVGLFLEEMLPPKNGITFTCRVRRLSDFWVLRETRTRILREATENGIEIDRAQLTGILKELAEWLWVNNLSLDYCDLTLFFDEAGNISSAKIIDLERLAFGELVNEKHPILDCLIDVKSYLLPEFWHETLEALFHTHPRHGRYLSLEEIEDRLRKKGRRRWAIINSLHVVESASHWFGPRIGPAIWDSFLQTAVKLTMPLNR